MLNSSKIGHARQTLNELVKALLVDTGLRGGIATERAKKMKALERKARMQKQANELHRKASRYLAQTNSRLATETMTQWIEEAPRV